MILQQTIFAVCLTCGKGLKSSRDNEAHFRLKHHIIKPQFPTSTLRKITKGRIGSTYVESILRGKTPSLLMRDAEGFKIVEYVESGFEIVIPENPEELPYTQYQDFSHCEPEHLEKDRLLDSIYDAINKTQSLKEDEKLFILAQILGSYCLDWMSSVHYLAFIGDISTGKSTILKLLQKLMYRPLYTTQISDWDILKFLGTDNDCNGVVLIDECQDIEKNRSLHDIFKQGYKKNNPITKNNKSFNTFSIYCLAGERLVDDRAIRDRTIPIYKVEGVPKIQLSRLNEKQIQYFDTLRDKLLLWKLNNLTKPENVELNIKLTGREQELFEDYLILLHGTKYYEPYKQAVLRYLEKRKQYSHDTFEAKLWREIKHSLIDGKLILSKLEHLVEAEDYGKPSKKKLAKTIKEKFGGIPKRIDSQRFYEFEPVNIVSFDKKYGVVSTE